MLLSRNPTERHAQYRNLIRECEASRSDRAGAYRRLRQIALTGSESVAPALYNRIWEFLRDATADILSPDNIRFSIQTPSHYGEMFVEECEAAREEFQRLWRESDAGLVASLAALWSRVFGTMVGKVLVANDEPTLMLEPDPSNIGVWNEASDNWARQEAICHWYEADLAQFRRLIYVMPDAELRKRAWDEAEGNAQPLGGSALEALGPAMAGIILGSLSQSTMTGTANLSGADTARARVGIDGAKLAELWVWDDEAIPVCDKCRKPAWASAHDASMPLYNHDFKPGGGWDGDYRVATVLLSSQTEPVIKEPLNPLLAGEHPFHGLTLHPVPGYIWGLSQVQQMYPLQEQTSTVFADILERLGKQADPPMVAIGIAGIAEQKVLALRRRGGLFFAGNNPQSKVEPFVVPMPPEAFGALEELSKMFDRLGGRRSRTREPGMRSGDQVMAEATLAGGAALEEAKRAQTWVESAATQMIRLHRRTSKTTLRKYNHEEQKETEFLLSQLPGDIVARIELNSSSPIHKQEIMAKVAFAAQQKALDSDDLIELLGLPYLQELKSRARRRARTQSQTQEAAVAAKVKESESKAKKNEAQALQLLVKAQNGG